MQSVASNNQATCVNCEESVHRYATRCPYCQHDLATPKNASKEAAASINAGNINLNETYPEQTSCKITHLPKADFKNPETAQPTPSQTPKLTRTQAPTSDQLFIPKEMQVVEEELEPQETSYSANLMKVLLPLICLLAGSFFFFFGLLLKLYSKNGKLVLSWRVEGWPYYVFPALFLILIGMTCLPRSETDNSET
jgi:hypothetical protein